MTFINGLAQGLCASGLGLLLIHSRCRGVVVNHERNCQKYSVETGWLPGSSRCGTAELHTIVSSDKIKLRQLQLSKLQTPILGKRVRSLVGLTLTVKAEVVKTNGGQNSVIEIGVLIGEVKRAQQQVKNIHVSILMSRRGRPRR